jgi:hypothetical protein
MLFVPIVLRDYCWVLAGHQHTLCVHSAALNMLFVMCSGLLLAC